MINPRERLTSGVTIARLRMEARRASRPAVVFGAGLVLAVAITGFLLSHISSTFGHKTYEVRFTVADDFGVFAGFDDVRFRGVPAGTISKVERDGTQLVLVAKIRKKYGPVYRDARAQIRPTTPLNDMYLDIVDPGTAKAGKAAGDDPLPKSQTSESVTIPEVLDSLGPAERRNAYRLLDQLGNGMADGGVKLRRAFVALVPFLEGAGELSRQVALRKETTKRLVHNVAVLTSELGRRQILLRRLVSTGAATVGTLQNGSADLDATLAGIAPTFTELRTSLAAVRAAVGDVDTGLTSLYPVAEQLPDSLQSIRRLDATLDPAVQALQRPMGILDAWVQGVHDTVDRLAPTTSALRPQVPTFARVTQRLVDCEKGVIGFFQWNSSLSKFGDQNGPVPRGNLAVGVPTLSSPVEPKRSPEQACTPGMPEPGVPTQAGMH